MEPLRLTMTSSSFNHEEEERQIDNIAQGLNSVRAMVETFRSSRRAATPPSLGNTYELRELGEEAKNCRKLATELVKLLEVSFIFGSGEELEPMPSVEIHQVNLALSSAMAQLTDCVYKVNKASGEGNIRLYQKVYGLEDIQMVERMGKAGFCKLRAVCCYDWTVHSGLMAEIHRFAALSGILMDRCEHPPGFG